MTKVIRVVTTMHDDYTHKTTKAGLIVPLNDKEQGWFECPSCGCQHDVNIQEAPMDEFQLLLEICWANSQLVH